MPAALARELAKRAQEETDRSISSVVRVLLTAALRDQPADAGSRRRRRQAHVLETGDV